ncbi:hypothetical protein [Streptomyces sp. wa22]|uniref:hypothetical protein n=1 Tax=Streptomyces sp. wa22 TaxID=1828244 RepID=UPI0021C5C724
MLCITRDLRWGRVSETFGEDPFLIGELAGSFRDTVRLHHRVNTDHLVSIFGNPELPGVDPPGSRTANRRTEVPAASTPADRESGE